MTFSIVARSADGQRWGVAVASKFLAAGAVVPGVRAPLGAIATQSFANLRYLPDGFALLAEGRTAHESLEALVLADDGRAQRQAGIIDGRGGAARFTGEDCLPWAGGIIGPGYAIQGNILTGADVVSEMERAFLASDPADPLALRLHVALLAGGAGAGYGGGSDIAVDLRVDDHPDPVVELGRLLRIHDLLFGKPTETWPLEGEAADRLRRALDTLGYGDPDLTRALEHAAGVENLEERLVPGAIDPVVLAYLEERATAR